jgi:hypothetical protein
VTPLTAFLCPFFAKTVMLPLVAGTGAAIQWATRDWCVEWKRADYLRAAVVASLSANCAQSYWTTMFDIRSWVFASC